MDSEFVLSFHIDDALLQKSLHRQFSTLELKMVYEDHVYGTFTISRRERLEAEKRSFSDAFDDLSLGGGYTTSSSDGCNVNKIPRLGRSPVLKRSTSTRSATSAPLKVTTGTCRTNGPYEFSIGKGDVKYLL